MSEKNAFAIRSPTRGNQSGETKDIFIPHPVVDAMPSKPHHAARSLTIWDITPWNGDVLVGPAFKAHIEALGSPEREMFSASLTAMEEIFTPPFRAALWKTLGLTLLILIAGWVLLDRVALAWFEGAPRWVEAIAPILTGFGLLFLMGYLIAPASSLVAGFFLDELAQRVEVKIGPQGRPLPVGLALWISAKFTLLSVVVNALALAIFLIPGFNAGVFLVANAFLLGREYFELAALRFRPPLEARDMWRRHALYLFFCGVPIAVLVAIPIINLLTPMFATAYMVRVHQYLADSDGARGRQPTS